jgi:hypothetical protein
MSSPFSPEILAQQKARHLAFLEARLVSPKAEAEWRATAAAVFAGVLAARVADVVDARALAGALDAVLTPDAVERAARPLGRHILPLVLREIRAEQGQLKDRVPADTKKRIDALLERPAVFPDRILRELAEQDAVEEVMRDVLYDGLKEFSEKVNPFTAEWGIPSLLKRMSVLGGAMGKGLESVRVEFDRRLEPEIRRFLTGFTRKGLRRMVEVTVARSDQPASAALRKHMLTWVLDQELGTLAREADAEAIALGQEIGMDLAAADLGREARRKQRRALVEELVAAAGDRTVGQALAELGVTLVPDVEALAAATWPLVKVVVGSDAVKGWLAALVGEFYDEEARAGA